MTKEENSLFLTQILLDSSLHTNIAEFLDVFDRENDNICICVTRSVGENHQQIRDAFITEAFAEMYYNCYISGLEIYNTIADGKNIQLYLDQTDKYYDTQFKEIPIRQIVSNHEQYNILIKLLEEIKTDHTYCIILRDEIAIICIHFDDDNYILIDPHVETSGIVPIDALIRYVTYGGIWDFDIYLLKPDILSI